MRFDHIDSKAVAVAEIVLCSSVPTQFLLWALLGWAGWGPLDSGGQLSLRFVLALSIADSLILLGLMILLTRAHGARVADLWLGGRPVKPEALYGLLLIPVVFVLVAVLLNAMRLAAPWLHNVPTNPLEQMASTPAQATMFGLVAIIAGGVREELQRAFLLRRFEEHLGGARVGVVVLSVGFGLGHNVQGWDAVVTTGVLGAIWAVIYLRRRSTVAPIVSHAGYNALEVLGMAVWGT